MARNYIHIQQYEEEIMELREQGLSLHQIGDRLGFSVKQLRAAKRKEKVTGELQLHRDFWVLYAQFGAIQKENARAFGLLYNSFSLGDHIQKVCQM